MSEPTRAGLGVWQVLVRPGSGLDAEVLGAWAAAVGASAVPRASAWTLREGTLTVRVQSSTWAQDLSLQRDGLLRAMAERLGEGRVRDLRFVVMPHDG